LLAQLHVERKKFDKARKFAEIAMNYAQKLNRKTVIIESLETIIEVLIVKLLMNMSITKKELYYLEELLSEARKLAEEVGALYSLVNLRTFEAIEAKLIGNKKDSQKFIYTALEEAKAIDMLNEKILFAYWWVLKTKEALPKLEEAYEILKEKAEKIKNKIWRKGFLKLFWNRLIIDEAAKQGVKVDVDL